MLPQQDQFERLLPTFIQVIDLTEEEESEYWMVVSAVFEGKEVVTVPASLKYAGGPTPATDPINNKVLSHSLTTWGFSILLFLFFG